MKRWWLISLILLIVFEWMRVYFIMPMPGSQQNNTLDIAYFLHQYRWGFRVLLLAGVIRWLHLSWSQYRKTTVVLLALLALSAYLTNNLLSADTMFLPLRNTRFAKADKSYIETDRLVIGVIDHGVPKAYPMNILAHHHQISDTLDKNLPIFATYCSVCRTAMVYRYPQKNGKLEKFRLVGMDHFNAMFEDQESGSWWQQATGEAVAGPRKGEQWTVLPFVQTTLKQWLQWYPDSWILQGESEFEKKYNRLEKYDDGSIESDLLQRSVSSNHAKNWLAWLEINGEKRSYSWEQLEKKKWLIDSIKQRKIMVVTPDNKSVLAFEVLENLNVQTLTMDSIIRLYPKSKRVMVHQEFRHSYEYFQQSKK